MGCSSSKLRADDTVRRCRDRRRFIKDAVYARHHLAAAHSDYCRSLRITASALVAFASGEPLSVSHHTPTLLRRAPSSPSFSPSPPIFHPPPTPPPPPPRSPLSTASSNRHRKPPLPRRNKIKLPHILSDSSLASSPAPINFDYVSKANSTYSNTPSQASSIWDWDHFYPPPSPPDSDYFHHFHKISNFDTLTNNSNPNSHHQHTDNDDDHHNVHNRGSHLQNPNQFDDVASNHSSYSRRRYSRNWETDKESETKREEVHCSEWRDHDSYSSSSSSSTNGDDDEEGEFASRSDYRTTYKSNHAESSFAPPNSGNRQPQFSTKSSSGWGDRKDEPANPDRTLMLRHQNFIEIAASLREHFDKAAAAGNQVSEMLETGRVQLDQSFKQLRKTIYHSTGILSNLTSTWTSKPPLTVKYRLELNSIEQCGVKGLCSTLDRLLAWEKKLYQEVKAREGVKLAHEKKLSVLQSQEYRGEEGAKLDKTKASIKRLQSLISVTSQAVSTTSFAIIGLRDSDLIPQLVELCHGFMYMWRTTNKSHEFQSNVVQQVRGLVTMKGTLSTTDVHRQATRDLELAVSSWHSSFHRIIKFHRDFVRAIHGWFKLTLLPVDTEPRNNNRDSSHALAFFDEWRLALDRVPDTVASEAIKSFDNIVHSISTKQSEELKMKKRADAVARELEKRTSALQTIEKKYYSSYSLVSVGPPDNDNAKDSGYLLDTRDPLAEKKAELAICKRRVEDEMVKHSKAVEVTRAMTLHNIQMGLPGVFDAMTGFSTLMTEALETVCTCSYSIQ